MDGLRLFVRTHPPPLAIARKLLSEMSEREDRDIRYSREGEIRLRKWQITILKSDEIAWCYFRSRVSQAPAHLREIASVFLKLTPLRCHLLGGPMRYRYVYLTLPFSDHTCPIASLKIYFQPILFNLLRMKKYEKIINISLVAQLSEEFLLLIILQLLSGTVDNHFL